MADKPTAPTLTLSALRKEAAQTEIEPFVLALDSSKKITFKDPLDIPVDRLDHVLALSVEAQRGGATGLELFRELLSPKDYEAYMGLNLPARAHLVLVQRVGDHFQQATAQAGGPGESGASPS